MVKTVDVAVQKFLAGRLWHREHMPFPSQQIDAQIGAGYIGIVSGIIASKKGFRRSFYQCHRCENVVQERFTEFICAKCEGPCAYCRQCLKMGRVSICTELVYWKGPPLDFSKAHVNNWKGKLTPLQEKASRELMESNLLQRSHLVFAVCGAGKTELLFEPIYQLLKEGKRICVAAPRVDVILELEPRFKAAFPKTSIAALYGGATGFPEAAQLILATTHQLYRFEKAFDVIFVDEADAFPYTADETLQKAVKKAAKTNGPIHFVTATPSRKMKQAAIERNAMSMIPRRFHGYPLPVPRFEALWRYNQQIHKGKLPLKLHQWMQKQLEEEKPFLLFFHTIDLMEKAHPLIQEIDERIQSVHAADPNRKEHVLALRNRQIPGLLTTTILERGITIPNVQVAVIGAEQAIFNTSALIQIGGRVGRAIHAPDGDFIMYHHGISRAMDEAKREIVRLNRKQDKR